MSQPVAPDQVATAVAGHEPSQSATATGSVHALSEYMLSSREADAEGVRSVDVDPLNGDGLPAHVVERADRAPGAVVRLESQL